MGRRCRIARAKFAELLRHTSLRFDNPATERAYIGSRAPGLVKASLRLFAVCLAVALPSFFLKVFRRGGPEDTGFFVIEAGLITVLCAACVLHIVLAATGLLERRFNCFVREHFVVGLTIVVLLAACCGDPYYLAKICGCAAPALPATDTTVLLKIDGVVTLAHCGLPVRCEALLSLDAAALLVFGAFAFGLGSPEQENAPQHWVLLLALIVGSLVGRRNTEGHERASFLKILADKTQRTELEYALSRQRDAQAGPAAGAEDATSVAPTNTTGRVFSEADPQGLCAIAGLGLREHWLLPTEALELAPRDVLGRGSFGIVVAGLLHGTPVAVKVPASSADSEPLQRFAELANELRVLRQLRSTHVVSFHGACIDFDRGTLALVEELVEGPSLEGFLAGDGGDPRGRPDDAARHGLILGLCRGLQCLHEHAPCIVHGDLKPDNVRVELLCSGPRVKLLDFGLSRLIKGTPKPLGGTLRWMAPEVVVGMEGSAPPLLPSPTADIFSFGRLVYFIATGMQPLPACTRFDLVAAAKAGRVTPLRWPTDSSPFAVSCAPIAEHCMSRDPAARPGIRIIREDFSRLRLQDERSNGRREDLPAHPCTECVPWEAGLQQVQAAISRPRDPAPPAAPSKPGRRKTPGCPRGSDPPDAGDAEPIFDGYRLTPLVTQQQMVLMCLMSWNVGMRSTPCCAYHARIDNLRGLCDRLRERPCEGVMLSADFRPGGQCPNCLALHIGDQDGCHVCGCHVCGYSAQGDGESASSS